MASFLEAFKQTLGVHSQFKRWLVDMIQNQQLQLQSLLIQRKSLANTFPSLQDPWVCDINFLEDHISQGHSKIKDMARFVDDAKASFIISMNQKDAIINNLEFDRVMKDADVKGKGFTHASTEFNNNNIKFGTHKVIYRRFAGLFLFCVDITDNELAYLECILLFVEILDHFFSNV
ncbi:hypothetical protein QVD17_07632 [Tagetes erecta]|uniref:AP complex mu/sigma subunit domain-containing protein n=1 Tax=Tagetes erecta TaxID=13708 RepID=A0AAD8LM40_TARER|nr:hypothetical protein QVD17_07632 [Tagetes erecta]